MKPSQGDRLLISLWIITQKLRIMYQLKTQYICMRTHYQTMNSATTRDLDDMAISELTDEQLQERLRPAYEAIKQKKFAEGGYLTYYDPAVCPNNQYMVHEYRDRKELVRLKDNGQAHFVKLL